MPSQAINNNFALGPSNGTGDQPSAPAPPQILSAASISEQSNCTGWQGESRGQGGVRDKGGDHYSL